MKFFLDIGHPAYYHALKRFIAHRTSLGDVFFITARDKECTKELLMQDGINFYLKPPMGPSILAKCSELFRSGLKLLPKVLKFKPDYFLSFSSALAAQLSFILRKPSITLEDTETAVWVQRAYRPFSKIILTPSCFQKNLGKKQISMPFFKELSYLHPHFFKPDPQIRTLLNLEQDESYCLLRFVSWSALHDRELKGFTADEKYRLVHQLKKHTRVFISSENELPPELEKYRLAIPSWKMHDVIASAALVFGESATVSAEAAMLAVPSVYLDERGRGYTRELSERYKLIFTFGKSSAQLDCAIDLAKTILQDKSLHEEFRIRHKQMIKDQMDLTSFLSWLVDNYPDEIDYLIKTPDSFSRFML